MSKHTAGPWRFYDFSNDIKLNRIEIVALGKTVAHIYHSVQKEDLPNAQLIAAAPELLEVLQNLCEAADNGHVASYSNLWDDAKAAIAKAEGESNE